MIKQVIRLIRPGLFLPCFVVEKSKSNELLIRPRYLSICAADQRYFQGNRPSDVLASKLPMALFHEAVGEVLYDPLGELASGTFCVLLPGGIASSEEESNYAKNAFFRSSNADGFCQEVMCLDRQELLPISVSGNPIWPYVFTELMSVCCHALRKLERITCVNNKNIGIWGDGAMSFMMALTLSQLRPNCSVYVFGKHDDKLINFSFVERKINIAEKIDSINIDIAIECVGGSGAQKAIAQALDLLNPLGVLLLLGVSEVQPVIPTRLVLEKGLILMGASRSTLKDFETAISLIKYSDIQNTLYKIVSCHEKISNSSELIDIFKKDRALKYKTIIEVSL